MKTKLLSISLAVVLTLAVGFFQSAWSRDWSKEQLEVWATLEASAEAWAEGDVDRSLSFMHKKFTSWRDEEDAPGDKEDARRVLDFQKKRHEVLYYDLKPVDITLYGDVAVVHFYYHILLNDTMDREHAVRGRLTNVLKKEAGKWLVICDVGRVTSHESR
jgi:ketosteroid isomerase-like protein